MWRKWWTRPRLRSVGPEWRRAVDQATHDLAWSLQTLSPNAIELVSIWISHAGIADKVLVDTSSVGFRAQCPMRVEDFRAHQLSQCEKLKNLLWTMWVPKCAEVFRRMPPLFINNDSEAYWRSVATLQSNQLRTLVQDSLDIYVAFFESHPAVSQVDPDATRLLWHQPAAFRVELVIGEDRQVTFSPPLEVVEQHCIEVIRHMTRVVRGIPRVETAQVAPAGAAQVAHDQAIPAVQEDEECVREAERRIGAVLRANREAPWALAALFEEFMFLVNLDVRTHCDEFQKGGPGLDQYTDELERFQRAAAAIEVRSREAFPASSGSTHLRTLTPHAANALRQHSLVCRPRFCWSPSCSSEGDAAVRNRRVSMDPALMQGVALPLCCYRLVSSHDGPAGPSSRRRPA